MTIEAVRRAGERSTLRIAALALAAAGLTGVAAGVLMFLEIVAEARAGGIGSFAIFAIPYAAVMLGLAIFVVVVARRVSQGAMLRTGAFAGVAVASIALVVVVNGQWFQDPLEFKTTRCGVESCHVSSSTSRPQTLNVEAAPVAIWGALAASAIAADRLRHGRRRRFVVAWITFGCIAIAAAGLGGLAEGRQATEKARRTCASVLAAEAGINVFWGPTPEPVPRSYVEQCADPASVARTRTG